MSFLNEIFINNSTLKYKIHLPSMRKKKKTLKTSKTKLYQTF